MKTSLLIVFNLAGATVLAQPVIPASHAENGTYTYSHADNQSLGSLDPGPAGANQTWNFSQYAGVGTTTQINADCPGDINCADFPVANKIGIVTASGGSGTAYHYSTFSNNQFSTIGGKNVLANGSIEKTIYDDPSLSSIYPITYQQTFTDTWSTHSDPPGYNSSGSKTVTADAYGTLTTPMGTFNNVLRIKTEQTFTQNAPSAPAITSNSTIYNWVSPGVKGTLLLITFNDVMVPGAPVVHTRSFTFGNNGPVSVADRDNVETQISIYPNPASDLITIKSPKEIVRTELSSVEGSIILQAENSDQIDISKLSPGIYFLKTELKSGQSLIKKIIRK